MFRYETDYGYWILNVGLSENPKFNIHNSKSRAKHAFFVTILFFCVKTRFSRISM